jgi:hypothetical protein
MAPEAGTTTAAPRDAATASSAWILPAARRMAETPRGCAQRRGRDRSTNGGGDYGPRPARKASLPTPTPEARRLRRFPTGWPTAARASAPGTGPSLATTPPPSFLLYGGANSQLMEPDAGVGVKQGSGIEHIG